MSSNGHNNGSHWLGSVIFAALIVLAASGTIDRLATTNADSLLTKALTTYAITRTFNGVISVAQGTEIAIQPVGVGLTISAGQILDPLNDLIERFSWLVLAACASLGVQLVITDIFASHWATIGVAALGVLGILALWVKRLPGRAAILKFAVAGLFVRFLFAFVTLAGVMLSNLFLSERQDNALAEVNAVSATLENSNRATTGTEPTTVDPAQAGAEAGIIDRIDDFFSSQRQTFDVEARLDRIQRQAETAIAALINLIVVFLVQTVVFPLGLLWAAIAAFRLFWRNWAPA